MLGEGRERLFIYLIGVSMVLQRHPKKYKHFIRIMLTQLVEHENLTTTRAKVNLLIFRPNI